MVFVVMSCVRFHLLQHTWVMSASVPIISWLLCLLTNSSTSLTWWFVSSITVDVDKAVVTRKIRILHESCKKISSERARYESRPSSSSGILLFAAGQWLPSLGTSSKQPSITGSKRQLMSKNSGTVARHLRSSHRWESCLGKIAEVVSRCLPRGFCFRVSFSCIVLS